MALFNLIYPHYKVVSLIGMAKNAGKTMTLNHIIESAMEQNVTIGLTSTGRDGEKEDIVTRTEKPTIYVERGTIIATAKELLLKCEAKIEILEVTEYNTSLGSVVIGRVRSAGLIELAGPDVNAYMKDVVDKIRGYGAELVLIDGAIDRKSAASPWLAEAAVLSTGATISRSVEVVKNETLHQVELFRLEQIEDEAVKEIAMKIHEKKGYAFINKDGSVEELSIQTALNSGCIIGSAINEHTKYVIVSGSLVARTLADMMEVCPYYRDITFIVQDATRIFIDRKYWKAFRMRGVKVKVVHPINLLAVTTNPYGPEGYFFEPRAFVELMRTALDPMPVIDVKLEG
ncbi:lysine 5,6-aminomutase reactivase subunit KamB [Alkaliphilus oremlandii]|uniref:Uncharacterized protein n=1 Tax=Alkaliphilus oremlandii (strain OhILAs) TaxID=350688 RepID=A8MLR4_ALKOO|nr:hypothetical protein [Alkaliphilus oremlandii]ABW17981.1 conserved hypothetical protein [Alkaliphilus oremlandii OhILAs]